MNTIFITLMLITSNFTYGQNHNHHHANHPNKNNNQAAIKKQFEPTNDLKVRIEKIIILMKEIKTQKDDAKIVKEYGSKLTDIVNNIFETCKLEPEADAAIHPALGLILDGANEFKNGKFESGHRKIHEALLDYEKLFKHEGRKLN